MKRVLAVLVVVAALGFAVSAIPALAKGTAKTAAAAGPVTLKGEIVDCGCYLSKGAKGEDHKECAQKCISGGMPMGLLTGDNRFYLLTVDHQNADPYNKCKDLVATMVEITGKTYTRHGVSMIDVTDVKAATN